MDLQLIESGNGGELVKMSKDLALVFGYQNMPYLAMFGGNVAASTPNRRLADEQAFDYWGNTLVFPNDKSLQFNSLTEKKLNEVALNSNGRLQIEQTVLKDLDFMKEFAEVTVSASITATDQIEILISVKEPGNLQEKKYTYIWSATKNELSILEE